MGNRTMGQQRPMQPYGGRQPRNMMQPKSYVRDGGEVYTPSYNPPPMQPMQQGGPSDLQGGGMSRAQMAQQRRNRLFGQTQNPVNLYQGQGAGHLSAVMGNNLGAGFDPNTGYIVHDYGGGKYGVNQGNASPEMTWLNGDYSRFFK